MGQEREVQTPSGTPIPLDRSKEEAEYRALTVQIASRSILQTGLLVDIPPDLHGEWISNDKFSISQSKSLGFDFPSSDIIEHSSSLHNDGTGKLIMGDVVFMVIPKWKKKIIDEEQNRRVNALHSMQRKSAEERVFLDNAKGKEIGIETFSESNVTLTTKHL